MVHIPSRLFKASGIRSWVCNAPFQSFLIYFILFVYIIKEYLVFVAYKHYGKMEYPSNFLFCLRKVRN